MDYSTGIPCVSSGEASEGGLLYRSGYPDFCVKKYQGSGEIRVIQARPALAFITQGKGNIGELEIQAGDSVLIQDSVLVQAQDFEMYLCSTA